MGKEQTDPVAYEAARRKMIDARGQSPARVLKSDMPFPTNRTTEFQAGEGSITFNKDSNTVSFDTGQYRDVIAKAHNSLAGAALFAKLQTV